MSEHFMMNKETQEKLAGSLTAETTDLIPFLPCLLQDLWELGSNPDIMLQLIKKHMPLLEDTVVLDLATGKGAVAIKLAQNLNVKVNGIDIIPAFIEYAIQKAKEFHVSDLCQFTIGDINEVVNREEKYDCVILGAVGDVLGNPEQTLIKLKKTIKPGGYILIDDAYLIDTGKREQIKYQNYEYLTHEQYLELFSRCGLRVVEEITIQEYLENDANNKAITQRAEELIHRYPEKRDIFEGDVKSQQDECADLEDNLVGVTWMLKFG